VALVARGLARRKTRGEGAEKDDDDDGDGADGAVGLT
jgi:hypothetical protein